MNCLIHITRLGSSAHYWVGPLGVHLFRHVGSRHLKPLARFSPVWLDFNPDWRQSS